MSVFEIKLLGSLIIIFTSTGCGFVFYFRLKKRVTSLEKFISLVQFSKREVVNQQNPITEVINHAKLIFNSNEDIYQLLKSIGQKLNSHYTQTFYEIIDAELRRKKSKMALNNNEISLLKDWARKITLEELSSQADLHDKVINDLLILKEHAQIELDDKKKLYQYGGFLSGLLLIILLY